MSKHNPNSDSCGLRPAIGYTRCSTIGQSEDGVTIAAQQARIEGWCQARSLQLLSTHTDEGCTGRTMSGRPGLHKALEHACSARAVFVVCSLSRASRSTRDCIAISQRLERAGADFASLAESLDTTTPSGRFAFRLFGSLGELEADLVSERTREALSFKRARGERTSGIAPYGYEFGDDGQSLVVVPVEQDTLARMIELRKSDMGWQRIGKTLDAEGMHPRTASRWAPETVRGICRRVMREREMVKP